MVVFRGEKPRLDLFAALLKYLVEREALMRTLCWTLLCYSSCQAPRQVAPCISKAPQLQQCSQLPSAL